MLTKFVLIPLLSLCFVTLLSIIAYAITAKYHSYRKKLVLWIGGSLCCIALLAVLICIAIYYNKKIANYRYYNSETATVRQVTLYVLSIVAILLIFGLSRFDNQKLYFNSRSLAYAGICTAMSYALSYIKLWDMPQGGSVTLVSLLPLMLYSYIFGARKGVFVGFTYGVLQALQDPWLIHPAQFLLDYPLAFSAVGLAGLFKNIQGFRKFPKLNFALGGILAGCMRFICHVLSGTFAFEAYAAGQNPWLYSLAYNAYVFVDISLVIVAGIFVLSSTSFLKTITKSQKA
jgi:thiamine transporter